MKDQGERKESILTEVPEPAGAAQLNEGELEGVSGGGIDSDNNCVGIGGSTSVFSFSGKG